MPVCHTGERAMATETEGDSMLPYDVSAEGR